MLEKGLSKRQADLIGYLYINEDASVSLQQYALDHEIVRQTARKDLTELIKLKLLIEEKKGKTLFFRIKSKSEVERYLGER